MRLTRQNIRLAVRSLSRHRGFAIVAVLSLALAIALNTTMFSVLDAMISPNTELRDADRLYFIRLWGDYKHKVDDATRASLLTSGLRSYEAVSYYAANSFETGAVEFGQRYAQVRSATVAPNLFRMFGSRPTAGRLFTDADFTADTRTAVISDRLAATLSPDRPFVLGSVIDVDGRPFTVIGVIGRASLPPRSNDDLWMLPPSNRPLASLPINVLRLRSRAPLAQTIAQAVAELDVVSGRLATLAGESPRDTRFQLVLVMDTQFHFMNFHYALIAAVIAVLLIACANLANLQLARGIGRSRELALRAALGASRGDIIAQLLAESALLAALGLTAGLLLTFWGVHFLQSRVPPSVAEYVVAPQISWRVLAAAATASVICTIFVGLLPAIHVSRVDPNELLKSGAGTGANKKNRRQYGVMVAFEVGLSLAVLSGAAIVVRSAAHVRRDAAALDVRDLSQAWIFIRPPRDTIVSLAALSAEFVARLRAIPDARDVGFIMNRSYVGHALTVDERGGSPHEVPAPMNGAALVSPGYLRTFGRRIVRGRDFLEGVPGEPEVIVDEHTARALWPNVDPIGERLKLGEYKSAEPWARVVGVVRDYKDPRTVDRLSYAPPRSSREVGEIFYVPSSRDSVTVHGEKGLFVTMLIRARTDPERMPSTAIRRLPKGGLIWFAQVTTLEEAMGLLRSRQSHNFVASVFAVFGAMAVGLAAFGIYGIVAHSVAERKRELGVRIALGATSRNVVHAVIREGNPVVLLGVAIGLWFTKDAVTWLHAFSLEGDENDALLFAGVAVILFATAVVAALVPALRATRIDPVESLRSE